VLQLQRTAGNAAVNQWLAGRGRVLSRLESAPAAAGVGAAPGAGAAVVAPAVWTPVDIATMDARTCWWHLQVFTDARYAARWGNWPVEIDRGPMGRFRFVATDRAALKARIVALLPAVVQEFQGALAGDAAIFAAHHVTSPNAPASQMNLPPSPAPIVQQLSALLDAALLEGRFASFDEWMVSKLAAYVTAPGAATTPGHEAQKQLQRGDAMNELREAFARLAGGDQHTTVGVGETPIPRAQPGPSADLDVGQAGARQSLVEIKTIRDPVVNGQGLIGQIGPSLSKFQGATEQHHEAVVYASYDVARFPNRDNQNDAVTAALPNHVLAALRRAATLPGKENVRWIIVRMENGKSFKFVRQPPDPNAWIVQWL
jgi:hypothetical protein